MTRLEALFWAAILFLLWELYANIRNMFNGTDSYGHYLQQEKERRVREAVHRARWAKYKARVRAIFSRVQRAAASIAANLTGG